ADANAVAEANRAVEFCRHAVAGKEEVIRNLLAAGGKIVDAAGKGLRAREDEHRPRAKPRRVADTDFTAGQLHAPLQKISAAGVTIESVELHRAKARLHERDRLGHSADRVVRDVGLGDDGPCRRAAGIYRKDKLTDLAGLRIWSTCSERADPLGAGIATAAL